MEPNKIDNEFRKTLHSRIIKPSLNSWDRLDAMLTVTENKAPKRKSTWYFRAACVLLFISIGNFLYFLNSKPLTLNQKVVIQENKIINHAIETNKNIVSGKREVVANEKNTPLENKTPKNKVLKSTIPNPKLNKNEIIYQKTDLTLTSNPKEIIASNPDKEVSITPTIDLNVKKTPTKIASLEPNKTNWNIQINSNTLLKQVDGELEETFRETKLEKIKKNFQILKVAIATRNQE